MVIQEKDSLYFPQLSKIKVNFTYTNFIKRHIISIYTLIIQMSLLLSFKKFKYFQVWT